MRIEVYKKHFIFLLLFIVLGSGTMHLEAQSLEQDSIALDSLYKNANGIMWESNWGSGVPVSEWDGITVENGRVEGIYLDISIHKNLTGPISTYLYLLNGLKKINLRDFVDLNDLIDLSLMAQLDEFVVNNCDSLEIKNFESQANLEVINISNMPLYHEVHYENLINLSTLQVYKSNLEELFGFDNLVDLKILNVGFNSISVIPSLENNLSLEIIEFGSNPLIELPETGQLSELRQMQLQNLGLQELPDLSNFPNLTDLNAPANQISEFPDLSNNPRLISINLGNNNLSEVPKIEGLDLDNITLSINSIVDIDVSGMPNLRSLNLGVNKLKTIKGVEELTGLTALLLEFNDLDTLQDLPLLTNLNRLTLDLNNLTRLPELSNGLVNLFLDVENNKLPFSELERIDGFGFVNLNLNYTPQFPDLTTNNNAPPIFGDSLMLTIPVDGLNSAYTWYKNDIVIPGLENLTEPILVLDSISLLDKGFYQCEVSNSQYTGHSYRSDSLFLQILGEDSLGGLYIYDQLIVEYETLTSQSTRDSLRLEFDASVVDQCLCGDFLELWQFDSLAFKPIKFDSFGTTVFLTDPDEIKKKAKRKTRVNEAGFNYPMNLRSLGQASNTRYIRNMSVSAPPPPPPPSGKPSLILIDTGIDTLHDLESYYWVNEEEEPDNCLDEDVHGYNFADGNANTTDIDNGHGTHMAGIITENLKPMNDFHIINAKAFGDDGYGVLFDAICAVYYGIQSEADIYNLSWGYYGAPVTVLENALKKTNALLVSSAGNGVDGVGVDISKDRLMHFPGSFDLENMVTVAAWDNDANDIASFSNYSDSLVHIAANGVDITPSDEYGTKSGTSQAAAAVSAAALCLKMDNPDWGYAKIKEELLREVNARFVLEDKTISGGFLGSCVDGLMVSVGEASASIEDISIYPNPFDYELHVHTKEKIRSYSIYDLQGSRLRQKKNLDQNIIVIETEGLDAALYLLELEFDHGSVTKKIIKQ